VNVHDPESRLPDQLGQSPQCSGSEVIATTQAMHGDTGMVEQGDERTAALVDHGDLHWPAALAEPDRKIHDDPLDSAEIKSFRHQQHGRSTGRPLRSAASIHHRRDSTTG